MSAVLTHQRKIAIVEPFRDPSGKTQEEMLYEFLLKILRLHCEARPCGRARCRRSGKCQEVEDARRDFDPTTEAGLRNLRRRPVRWEPPPPWLREALERRLAQARAREAGDAAAPAAKVSHAKRPSRRRGR
jgi:hypothetical protein